jgi:glutamate synthase (ferredoxin)
LRYRFYRTDERGEVASDCGASTDNIGESRWRSLPLGNHRGACGCETNTGDGAGILMQVPHKFMQKVAAAEGIELPAAGQYGVGAVYGSPDPATRSKSRQIFAEVVAAEGL